jgi:ABC-type antimicrobial peptide transport system permease subunit
MGGGALRHRQSLAAVLGLWGTVSILGDFAAFRSVRLNFLGGEDPAQITAAEVTDGFFRTFGVGIVEGRGFLPEDSVTGAPRAVVISRRMRDRSFRPGADVVGERIELSGVSYEVIGVAAGGFDLGQLREFRVAPLAYLPFDYWLMQILDNQLFDVEPRDPLVFTLVPVVVILVALCASWGPAHRASRIEPLHTIRFE